LFISVKNLRLFIARLNPKKLILSFFPKKLFFVDLRWGKVLVSVSRIEGVKDSKMFIEKTTHFGKSNNSL
jgi:hypothetical protein